MILKNDGALERWLKLEYHNLNKNVVNRQVSLAELLKMSKPETTTRGGEAYKFDPDALKKLGAVLPQVNHKKLSLPILFYRDLRVKDSCFIADRIAFAALQCTGDLDTMYEFRNDKVWLSRPLALEIANRYPTLFQFIVY